MKYGNFVLDGIRDFDKEAFGNNGKDEKCECERCGGRGWLYWNELSEEEKKENFNKVVNYDDMIDCPVCEGKGEI